MQPPKTRGWPVWALAFMLLSGLLAQAANDPDITLPRPLKQEQPKYPPNMAEMGVNAEVEVAFVITAEGNVINIEVIRSNNPWFDRPAIDAVLQWKFSPAVKDGRKVAVSIRQILEFQMEGRAAPRAEWLDTMAKARKRLPPEMQWDTAPEPVHTEFPVYPYEDLRAGRTGSATVFYLIGADGTVTETKLQQATTPEMGRALLAMIETWRFKPARKKNGTPIETALGIEHDFEKDKWSDLPVTRETSAVLKILKNKPETIVAADELDHPLKPQSQRHPVHPLEQKGKTGSAVIEFFVGTNGDAQLPHIISCTAPEFGYAAVQAAATWRFEAPRKAGKPVVVRVSQTVEFTETNTKPAPAK